MELSVVIPAFNEARAIRPTLEQLVETLSESDIDHEIIVVDDGSTDGTSEIVQRLAESLPDVRLVVHKQNRGYGAALKSGIRAAQSEVVAITDADGTYPNERIPELYRRLVDERADMVVGSRTGENVHIPLVRRPAKWLLRVLANYLSGHPIPDLNSGLRVMSKAPIVQRFNLVSDGFSFTTTTLLALLARGQHVVFVPIDYHARTGNSKIRPIRDTFNFLVLILRVSVFFEPLKVFLPATLAIGLGGVGLGAVQLAQDGGLGEVPLLLVLSALQIGLVGLIADMISRRN
jgi:glycosyltransferase involved in cell wall biosynthesis